MKKVKINFYNRGKTIRLPQELIQHFNIQDPTIVLKIGYWSKTLRIKTDHTLHSAEIKLPSRHIPFKIPEHLDYEVYITNNTLHIGPVIAMLVSKTSERVSSKKLLDVSTSRLQNYESLNGLIYICSLEDINLANNTIKGHYFSPSAKEKWKKGIFPLPDSVYNRIRIPDDIREQLIIKIGDTIFNSKHFDKHKLWEVCSNDPEASSYVPDTLKLDKYEDFKLMIEKHKFIYIKPIVGTQGKGIIAAKKVDDTFVFQPSNTANEVNITSAELKPFLERHLNDKNGYLLQQAIDTKYQNKKVDFRFYFQKDKDKKWICQEVVGRIANETSIVTNYKHLSDLVLGEEAIQLLYNVEKDEAASIIKETIAKCNIICELIDKELGHYGDIAIDVVLDYFKNPYVLEINNRVYATKSLKRLNLLDTFSKIRSTPLEYAKALSGFN